MSISSIAEDSALRLTTPQRPAPTSAQVAGVAAASAAAAIAGGADQSVATERGTQAGQEAQGAGVATPSSPLATLVKYIPTESIALYVAIQAALGNPTVPVGGILSDADFTSRWIWMWVLLGLTVLLTTGLSYRAQKNANNDATFRFPTFDVLAASAAFMVWAMALPSTPLSDFAGYDYSAWSSVLILGGTIAIATTAYVLGKTVTWTKVVDT